MINWNYTATPPSHLMERSDDEESVDDDWVEVQQLEREVMAQLDNEITVAEGAQLMHQLVGREGVHEAS